MCQTMGYKRVREAKEFVKSAPQKAEELKNYVINKIIDVDDGVQSFVRTKALGLMDDGSMLPEGAKLGTLREILGGTVFAKSPAGFSDTAYRMDDTAAGVAATLAATIRIGTCRFRTYRYPPIGRAGVSIPCQAISTI